MSADAPSQGPLTSEQSRDLLRRAHAAREYAYAPYSGFRVGAALLDAAGRVHSGANVENVSYGLGTCAERTAVVGAVAQGVRDFRAIAVAGPSGPCLPCGSCRQILHEFAPGVTVIVEGSDGEPRTTSLGELLPEAFGPGNLSDRSGGP
jgi:cytidine deaminase